LREVDILIVGGGPATLGFLCNATKFNRLKLLLKGKGMAILEKSTSLGGGNL